MELALFKTKAQRERKQRKDKRRAFRRADRAIDEVRQRIEDMGKVSNREWVEAREALKEGKEETAQRLLVSYRGAQVMMTQLAQKLWVFERFRVRMHLLECDSEFSQSLSALNSVIEVDPDRAAEIFDTSKAVFEDQAEYDKLWERMYREETDGAVGSLEDHIPSLEELRKELEAEAASDVEDPPGLERDVVGERVRAGRARLAHLMDPGGTS